MTYVFIHGAGDVGWSWHLVAAELRALGHDVVAPDLPCEDESAGLAEYSDTVLEAIGDRTDLVLVGHSLGGFVAPLVCARRPVELLVLVAGMIPAPGETFGDWWTNTGYSAHQNGRSEIETFLHDVPPELAAQAMERGRDQAEAPLVEPWPLAAWPDVPTRFIVCRDDRVFPADWLRGVVRDRLGIEPDEIDGSHGVYLSRPRELAQLLEVLRAGVRAATAPSAASPVPPS